MEGNTVALCIRMKIRFKIRFELRCWEAIESIRFQDLILKNNNSGFNLNLDTDVHLTLIITKPFSPRCNAACKEFAQLVRQRDGFMNSVIGGGIAGALLFSAYKGRRFGPTGMLIGAGAAGGIHGWGRRCKLNPGFEIKHHPVSKFDCEKRYNSAFQLEAPCCLSERAPPYTVARRKFTRGVNSHTS